MPKYTKDFLIDNLFDVSKQSNEAMNRIANAVDAINDTNILHSQTIEQHSMAIREIIAVNKSVLSFFRVIIMLLLAALIVVAGAEKAFDFGIFK